MQIKNNLFDRIGRSLSIIYSIFMLASSTVSAIHYVVFMLRPSNLNALYREGLPPIGGGGGGLWWGGSLEVLLFPDNKIKN